MTNQEFNEEIKRTRHRLTDASRAVEVVQQHSEDKDERAELKKAEDLIDQARRILFDLEY
jgi:hypothetical protein